MRGAGGETAIKFFLGRRWYSLWSVTFYAGKAGAVVRKFGVDKSDVVLYYFLDEDS